MSREPDYLGLSKRFASLAARASDPLLANFYRKLSETYRTLDFWHERFKRRYERIAGGAVLPEPEDPDRGK
jgi:hypothetical protein